MSDAYKERPDDHLIEPFFGGLGVGAEPVGSLEPAEPVESVEPRRALPKKAANHWLRRLLERLGWKTR